jgi:hypothetical protein
MKCNVSHLSVTAPSLEKVFFNRGWLFFFRQSKLLKKKLTLCNITRKKHRSHPKHPQKKPKTPSKHPKIELLPVHFAKSRPEHTRVLRNPHPVQVAKTARNHKNTPKISRNHAQSLKKKHRSNPKHPQKNRKHLQNRVLTCPSPEKRP